MSGGPLRQGEFVLFLDGKERRYLKELRAGHRITIRGTSIRSDDVIGMREGTCVGSPERFRILRPSYAELVTLIERPAEPVFAKDAGAILIHADIGSGDVAVEIGVGAGMLTLALLRVLGPAGRLVSYEIRDDFARLARTNVARFHGSTPNWTLKIRDAATGIDERNVDRVVIDVPEPSRLVEAVAAVLRLGGTLAVYLPTVPQVQEVRKRLDDSGAFGTIETIEVLERSWNIKGLSVRPVHRMVAHTAFLTFARRIAE